MREAYKKNKGDQLSQIMEFLVHELRFITSDHLVLLARYEGIQLQNNDVATAFLHAKKQKIIKRSMFSRKSDLFSNNSINRTAWKSLLKSNGNAEKGGKQNG